MFERLSLVDAVFAADSRFEEMDFPTRTLYRSAVEELARGSKRTELDIASAAVLAASGEPLAAPTAEQARRGDPGYHLLAGGRRAFEAAISYRPPMRNWVARLNRSLGVSGYVDGDFSCRRDAPCRAAARACRGRESAWPFSACLASSAPFPRSTPPSLSSIAGSTLASRRRCCPVWNCATAFPRILRTLVAVPTLLTTWRRSKSRSNGWRSITSRVRKAICISRWFPTGPTPQTNTPKATWRSSRAAAEGIARLNLRYGPAPGGVRFLLLHRRRVWNEGEARWIGWERKRGKLHELNRLLRAATDTTFIDAGAGPPVAPTDVRYVVTLDADTRLPRDAVRRLIGKMAHPLNRPRFDAAAGRVVEGYAVLQPRVTPSLPIGREGSLFQRIFSSLSGIDPYASAVSDVYQDLFGEGSYAGKGIYDVDAFEAALAGRAPDSTLLSHDLFEGVFARAGLASDIEVVEEFPARYDVGALRHHRWARGDWQLLPWILGRAPRQAGAERATSAIPAIGRWKMLDNLRRTLSAPAAVLALLAGWTLPLHAALIWTLFVVLTIVLPTLIPVVAAIPPRRPGVTIIKPCARARRRSPPRLDALGADHRVPGGSGVADGRRDRPHPVALGRDAGAICSNGFRRRRRRSVRVSTSSGFTRRMAGAIVIGAVAAIVALAFGRGSWPLALPFAALWVASPAVARRVSLSPGRGRSLADVRRRRRCAEADRTPHLAVLRDLRHAGRQHAAARQFSGQPDAGDRASDVADQSRPLSPFRRQRSRLRLDRDRPRRSIGSRRRLRR